MSTPINAAAPGPGVPRGGEDHQGTGSLTSIGRTAHAVPSDTRPGEFTTPDLASMAPKAQRIALEWYQLGYLDGIGAGRAQVEAEDAARWAELRKSIRATAQAPDYAELCRRRGDHARAEATERLWAERGVA